MKQEQVIVTELLPQIYNHINVVVRSACKEALEQCQINKPSKVSNIDEDFLSTKQAAAYLKIEVNTVYSKVEKGELPFSRSGKRKLLFCMADLKEYVSQRKVKSQEQINEDVETYIRKKK